jgi:predicted permease
MDSLLQDLKYGIRMLFKHPGLAAISVLALALGLGLTTTMFSIVNGAIIRGLPFEESDRLLNLKEHNLTRGNDEQQPSIHDFTDWRAQQTSFVDLAAFYGGTVNVAGDEGRPERYNGSFITPSAFRLVRVPAMLGRTFVDDEGRPDAPLVILLGYNIWKNRFGSDRAIVGRAIRVNGQTATVVGVMPEGFKFPVLQDLWLPLHLDPLKLKRGEGQSVVVFGRLKPGVTADRAGLEFTAIARRLAQQYPETNKDVGVVMKPYAEEFIGKEPRALLFTMLGAVFAVLLIACSNVANLLLARAAVRTKEVAIRTALGASRCRVVSQLLAEAVVLSAVGAVLGIGIAALGVRLFNNAIVDSQPPFWIDIRIDGVVLLFVLGVTLLASLIAGTLPALQATGANVNEVLKDESRGSSSFRLGKFSRGLVVAEIALSCGLLVAAGLMVKSVVKLKTFDYGVATRDVFTARVGLFEAAYPDSLKRQQFWTGLVQRLEAKPGVRGVALTSRLPALGTGTDYVAIEGKAYATDRDYPEARSAVITPGYFQTFGASLAQGRAFGAGDDGATLPVAIVNQSFSARFFPGATAIGRRFRTGRSDSHAPWRTIVGVVPDLNMNGTDSATFQGFYVPLAQSDARFISIAIRARADPMALAPMVQSEVAAIDPDLPIYFVQTEQHAIDQNTWFYGVFGTLFMVFGFVALFLATVGVYGVMSFAVSRRTQEVGVRMALGAGRRDVIGLFLRQGAIQVGAGVTIGLGLAFLLSRMLRIILFRVEPTDPVMFAGITLVLVATGLLACFIPARRATRVDPMVALRYE